MQPLAAKRSELTSGIDKSDIKNYLLEE